MSDLLLAIGLVCVIEGLVFALAPSRFQDLLRQLAELPVGTRRTLGLSTLALGVGLIWIARVFAG